MVQVLTACKQRFKVACLTNNVKSGEGPGMARTSERASQMQRVMDLFDVVLESSKEGIRKPNPAFYLRACERLAHQAEPGGVSRRPGHQPETGQGTRHDDDQGYV